MGQGSRGAGEQGGGGAEYKEILTSKINKLHKLLFFTSYIEVPYDENHLTMAQHAVAKMKGQLVKALGEIDTWLNPALCNWPKVRDLPEEEQVLFSEWMKGQTRPHLPDEADQDGYYPQDYDQWQHERHNRYSLCQDQMAQIDCRIENCMYYEGKGQCANVSPAITLNSNGKFTCWTHLIKPSKKETGANAHN